MRLAAVALALAACAQARDLPGVDVDSSTTVGSPTEPTMALADALGDIPVEGPPTPADAAPASREDAGTSCSCPDVTPACLDCGSKCWAPPLKVTGLYLAAAPVEMSGDFCAMAVPVAGMGYAWEPTADYAGFLAKWRPRICDGRPPHTALVLVVWSFDSDGTHGTKAVASQACP
jgi:hypothetical protein